MRAAGLVIAGEGCIDDQSFGGKIVGELVRRSHAAGVPIHAVVGSSKLPEQAAARGPAARLDRLDARGALCRGARARELCAAGRELGAAAR